MRQIMGDGLLGRIVSFGVKKIEKNACIKSDLIVACSEQDKNDYMKLYGIDSHKIVVVPNATDTQRFSPVSDEEKRKYKEKFSLTRPVAFFVGSQYGPNIDAARFIIKKIAPRLPQYDFVIAGSVINAVHDIISRQRLPPNIHLHLASTNAELDDLLKTADIALNPMSKGSGIQIKMLDYFAMGLPVVSTSIGARGLGLSHEIDCLIVALQDFPREIHRVFNTQQLAHKLASNARSKALLYDKKKLGERLEKLVFERYQSKILSYKQCIEYKKHLEITTKRKIDRKDIWTNERKTYKMRQEKTQIYPILFEGLHLQVFFIFYTLLIG
jgi:glycosyltransferase involved in cell wall biosynthesis